MAKNPNGIAANIHFTSKFQKSINQFEVVWDRTLE